MFISIFFCHFNVLLVSVNMCIRCQEIANLCMVYIPLEEILKMLKSDFNTTLFSTDIEYEQHTDINILWNSM